MDGRPLGRRVEWHHSVPKSRGGRETVPVHPICHRAIHRALGNKELERDYASADALRGHDRSVFHYVDCVNDTVRTPAEVQLQ